MIYRIQDDVVLEGTIYFDGTFFTLIEPQKKRKAHGKEYRGISRHKLCAAVAFDKFGHVLLIFEHTSKPSIRSTWNALGSHLKPGSHPIHDKALLFINMALNSPNVVKYRVVMSKRSAKEAI